MRRHTPLVLSVVLAGFILLLPMRTSAAVQATAGTVFQDKKNGVTLTLPSTWKKTKVTAANTLFVAQRKNNTEAQWSLTYVLMKDKKEADDTQKYLTTKPKLFSNLVLAELKKQISKNCTVSTAKKATLGSFTGAKVVADCTAQGKKYSIGFFAFVRKTTQYTVADVSLKTNYAKFKPEMDGITKTLKLSK